MKSYDKNVGKYVLWILIASIGFVALVVASIFPPLAALIVLAGILMKKQLLSGDDFE
ncbi:MAG: hypothetical protein II477_12795 [Lachnospiraceae bacterium]|jgi:hypothetical protein|nr:hypothetical protein [Lachnospiraceae bacterium]MBQ2101926.1 hypothetical protein [Lachnospiraceae bacterium]MBQ3905352.1 hypothetical protein [Lachnospiraceae bacterium]MCR4598168.1 hypothetical protein [Acetatifactor sp.]